MHKLLAGTLAVAALAGCGPSLASHVQADQLALGRVVIYRNGVAYYERRARVAGGALTVAVPRDRVDDFLKSLTVVDEATGAALPVSFSRRQATDAAEIAMTLAVPERVEGAVVRLTYVTEAPAWKPSYRLAMAEDGTMRLEGWAVIDNVSGEDWTRVEVGVGSSAAMSFRYDLWGVRSVERAELAPTEQFAVAPPTAVSPYGGTAPGAATVIDLDASELRPVGGEVGSEYTKNIPTGRTFSGVLGTAAGSGDSLGVSFSGSSSLENQYVVEGINTTAPGRPTATTGVVDGTIVAKGSREPVVGATVVAVSPALPDQQAAITDEAGRYQLAGLPPGTYSIIVYYGDAQFERRGVAVQAGRASKLMVPIDPSQHTSETIALEGRAPMIDQGSTRQGIIITSEQVRTIPTSSRSYEASPPPDPMALARAAVAAGDQKLAAVVPQLVASRAYVVVEGYAAPGEATPDTAALARANLVRNQLIDAGVAPARVRAVSKGLVAGRGAGVQLVTGGAPGDDQTTARPGLAAVDASAPPAGESYFLAPGLTTIGKGASAMVSVLQAPAEGELVYLYDPSPVRGNERFAFRAVRLKNPTDATLEPGPITVYGAGRYVGEGLTEAIAPGAPAVVPFALDRQVVVERDADSSERLERLASIQRGTLSATVTRVRTTRLTLTSRLATPTRVYLRHPVTEGWELVKPPGTLERIGDAYLVAIELPPGDSRTVELTEETPTEQVLDLGADPTLELLAVYVDSERAEPALRDRLRALLALHRALVDGAARIELLRERQGEYRVRGRELEGQLVSLRKVKGAGELQRSLQAKLDDVATRAQRTTLELVAAQEELLQGRIRFADALAELPAVDAVAARP